MRCVLSIQLQDVYIHCTPCNSRSFKDKKEKALCFIHLWPLRSILHEKGSMHCLQISPKWETDTTRIRCVLSKQLQDVNIHCTPCNSRFFKDKKEKTPCFILLWPLRSILHEKGSLHCLQFSPKWETDPTRIRCVLSKQLQEVNIHCTPCNSRFFKDKKEKTPCFILLWPLRSILHEKGSLHCLQI